MTPRSGRRPAAQVVDAVPAPPAIWPGLILGAGHHGPFCAAPEHNLLGLGPPRSGKTTALIIPNVLAAPGAVVSTSTKTEVLYLTGPARSRRGRCWLFDPSGTLPCPEPVTPLCWSPVTGAQHWTEAVATAHALARSARPARGLADADHWTERAEALVAPLLHAAALAELDMAWVLRWILRREITEPAVLIERRGGDELAADTLAGIAGTDERERSGIFSTAAGVLAAYRSPAAVGVAATPNFEPDAFVRSSDTIYIAAPADAQNQLAPLVVAFLDRLRRATYRREAGWPPVLWALDEVPNIAPLPNLPSIISEGASQGLVSLVCLQDLSQARQRWGAAADGFLTLFAWKLILPGIADHATLQLVSALAGDHDVLRYSRTRSASVLVQPTNTVTTSTERRPLLPPNAIAFQQPGTALAIGPHHPPEAIALVPCWRHPWSQYLPPLTGT